MTGIRRLERGDLTRVAELVVQGFPGFAGRSPAQVERFLARTLVEDPWADPELPSLVAEAPGRGVIGFVGVQARRLRAGDRDLRGVCCSHLVVDPEQPPSALGARLLGKVLAGAQDLTWSDSANSFVARMFATVGGQVDQVRRLEWLRLLRPRAWAARVLMARLLDRPRVDRLITQAAIPVAPAPAPDGRLVTRELVAAELAETVELAARGGLRLAYDEAWTAAVLSHLDEWFGRARVVRRLVCDAGRAVGSFVYVKPERERAVVVHLVADPRRADDVVGTLFAHAREDGVILLGGRCEPRLQEPLRRARCHIGFGGRALAHARDATLIAALNGERSVLGRFDGEWW